MAFNPAHQSKVQYLRRLRERYKGAQRLEACRLAHRILRHLADGDVTLAQMHNAWGMTAAEWSVQVVKLQGRADRWSNYKSAEQAMANEKGE